ncbi:hypothetical protein BG015_009713 [Linnemannia schmuckeri]|uniref:Guanylate kinase-like domain-containing protein n=1 Tax=Linnemannia schmuckeri TaxID=64567 RepID=A0A9P5RXU6_9FUNG|nr:hypothetical protein BG015_009713 [Linnemannia schmuckeri]
MSSIPILNHLRTAPASKLATRVSVPTATRRFTTKTSPAAPDTTRGPRPGEVDGVAYHFVSHATINDMISRNEFLEHAVFSENTYGTSRKAVQDIKDSGKICIMDIELQGVKQIRELVRKSREEGGGDGFEARYLLVRPPSLAVLEERLRARNTESEDAILKRLEAAKREWEAGSDPVNFECIVVNDDLDTAYNDLHRFIFGTREK